LGCLKEDRVLGRLVACRFGERLEGGECIVPMPVDYSIVPVGTVSSAAPDAGQNIHKLLRNFLCQFFSDSSADSAGRPYIQPTSNWPQKPFHSGRCKPAAGGAWPWPLVHPYRRNQRPQSRIPNPRKILHMHAFCRFLAKAGNSSRPLKVRLRFRFANGSTSTSCASCRRLALQGCFAADPLHGAGCGAPELSRSLLRRACCGSQNAEHRWQLEW
jgi:hypothetical protein